MNVSKKTKKPISDETRRKMSESQLKRRGWEQSEKGVLKKKCSRCKVVMDVTPENFSRDKSRWSGFHHRCHNCQAAQRGHVRTTLCFICGADMQNIQEGLRGKTKHMSQRGVCSLECLKKRKKMTNFAFNLWKKYKITPEDYEKMLYEQNNCCAICKTDKPRSSRKGGWLVDHDHETGQVRGLLCLKCNSGLGLFKDSVEALQEAVVYLNKTSQISASKLEQ